MAVSLGGLALRWYCSSLCSCFGAAFWSKYQWPLRLSLAHVLICPHKHWLGWVQSLVRPRFYELSHFPIPSDSLHWYLAASLPFEYRWGYLTSMWPNFASGVSSSAPISISSAKVRWMPDLMTRLRRWVVKLAAFLGQASSCLDFDSNSNLCWIACVIPSKSSLQIGWLTLAQLCFVASRANRHTGKVREMSFLPRWHGLWKVCQVKFPYGLDSRAHFCQLAETKHPNSFSFR